MWQRALSVGGGGSNELYAYFKGTTSSTRTFSISISGKAKEVYFIDTRGYIETNVNQSTREVSTNSVYFSTNTWGAIDSETSSQYVDCSVSGTITFNNVNDAYAYWIFYTVE